MERLEKRFRVSQWIAEEFAGVSHEEHQALLEDWRQVSVENEEEYQELLCEFMLGKNQPTLACTHFQPAQPTTVGKRATLWMMELKLDLDDLEYLIGSMRLLGS